MKKAIAPLLLFTAVLVSGITCRQYTFLQMENLGLFLNSSDYFRDLFAEARPISHLAANFLIQFFNAKYIGALIEAILLTFVAISCRNSFTRFRIPFAETLAVTASCAVWIISAVRNDFSLTVSATLIASAISVISLLFKRREYQFSSTGCAGNSAVIAVALLCIVLCGKIVNTERWSKIEYCAMRHDWKKVIDTATPELCKQDQGMLPYALLALSYDGRLPVEMFYYPIKNQGSLDTEGWDSQEGYFFGYLLYDCYGCTNEAIHQLFQSSSYLPFGSSFCTLRQLSRLCFQAGEFELARKYCTILDKSTLHRKWVRSFISQIEQAEKEGKARPESTSAESSTASLITHDSSFNTAALISDGLYSKPMVDRMLCSLLAQRNLTAFKKLLDSQRALYGDELPSSFKQALDILDNPMAGSAAGANYINYYFSGTE